MVSDLFTPEALTAVGSGLTAVFAYLAKRSAGQASAAVAGPVAKHAQKPGKSNGAVVPASLYELAIANQYAHSRLESAIAGATQKIDAHVAWEENLKYPQVRAEVATEIRRLENELASLRATDRRN